MILKVATPLVLWIRVICKGWYCCLMWFLFLISWWDPEMWDHLTRFLGNWPPKLVGSPSTKDNCLYLTSPVLAPLSLSLSRNASLPEFAELALFFTLLSYYSSLSYSVLHPFLYQQETVCLVQTNAEISVLWLPTTDWIAWSLRDDYFFKMAFL